MSQTMLDRRKQSFSRIIVIGSAVLIALTDLLWQAECPFRTQNPALLGGMVRNRIDVMTVIREIFFSR